MSTKIYNAYRFDGTLGELMKLLFKVREGYIKEVRPEIVNIHKELKEEIFNELERVYPELKRGNGKLPNIKEDWRKIQPAREKAKQLAVEILTDGTWANDIRASVVIYSYWGKLYFQTFGLDTKHIVHLMRKSHDWHYQSQTNKPKRTKDWQSRSNMWDKVFKVYSTPKMAGLVFEILDKDEIEMIITMSEFSCNEIGETDKGEGE